ncbi:type 2 periplasmic-binding domain-containing protein [Holzapfeliella sp. JNUCC 72]
MKIKSHPALEFFKGRIISHEFLQTEEARQQIEFKDSHVLSEKVIAMYSFFDAPIFSGVKTIIFDLDHGVIGVRASTRQLMNDFVKSGTLNFLHDRYLRRYFKASHLHTFCCGTYTFFSLKGYAKQVTDWVGLHHILDVSDNQRFVLFKSLVGLDFRFQGLFAVVHKFVNESVSMSAFAHQILRLFLDERGLLFAPRDNFVKRSLAFNDDYILHHYRLLFPRSTEKTVFFCTLMKEEALKIAYQLLKKEYDLIIEEREWLQLIDYRLKSKLYLW